MTRFAGNEKGSALVLASMIMVILTLLGISYLLTAQDENRIAVSERNGAQAQFVAEAGVRMVQRWFDDPTSTGFMVPAAAEVDRTERWVDDDDDQTYEAYAGADAPYDVVYRQGTDDLFEKPYRGVPSLMLLGTEDHPDLSIYLDTTNVAMEAFLTGVNDTLFPDFPAPVLRSRIERIDVYAPPLLDIGGNLIRYGVATVKVTASTVHFPGTADERIVATRTVRAILNEMPYPGPLGPIQSCKSIQTTGDFGVHWGTVTAVDDGEFSNNLDVKVDSGLPWYDTDSRFQYDNNGDSINDNVDGGVDDFDAWLNHADKSIEDPWFKVEMAGTLTSDLDCNNPVDNGQPYPYGTDPSPECYTDGYEDANVNPDTDHSNFFHHVDRELCPVFDYPIWKTVATSGLRNIHYYAFDSGSGEFLEDGVGASIELRDATHQTVGLFFFDTTDAIAPHDDDNDGVFDNLTPGVDINGGSWWTGGFVYFNGTDFKTTGMGNIPDRGMRAPGEPFQDLNSNNVYDSDEPFLQITYPVDYTAIGATYTHTGEWKSQDDWGGAYTRLDDGPLQNQNIHLFGVFYTNGRWDAKGNALYYGSVIAKGGVGESAAGAAGTPDVFFDERLLKGDWPPKELHLPRTYITEWETQH